MNKEIELTRSFDHPSIIKFYDTFIIKNDKQQNFIIIIEEYCSKGSLFDYINQSSDVNEVEI